MANDISTSIRRSLQRLSRNKTLSFHDLQEIWLDFAKTQPFSSTSIENDQIIAGIKCRWFYEPDKTEHPTILYFHGGGMISGDIKSYRHFASRLASITGFRVLLFEYSLHPEYSYPAALEDSVRLYQECVEVYGIDPQRTIFGGDSAGAGLMISTLCALRDRKISLPRSAFSISGVFDLTLSSESMRTREHKDPCFSHDMMRQWLEYFEDYPDLADSKISPLLGDLGDLPPLLVQVGEDEVWHDDSKRLAGKINVSGGTVQFRSWRRMWHAWPLYPDLLEAELALIEIRDFILSQ